MKLIDKDALVAEIEERRDSLISLSESCPANTAAKSGFYAQAQTLEGIKNFINTLEVKEVDLDNNMTDINFEEEIDNFMYGTRNPERFPDSFQVRDKHTGLRVLDWKSYVSNPKHKIEFAKYFFELGLKDQKGEKK